MPLEPHAENNAAYTGDDIPTDTGNNGNASLPPVVAPSNPPQPPGTPNPSTKDPDGWWKDRKYVLEVCGFMVLTLYTIFSGLQWRHMNWANVMTRESLNGNNSSLQQTLDKMTWQIKETHEIAKQTLTQATQTTKLATDTHDLAVQAKNQADRTKDIAETSREALVSVQRALVSFTGNAGAELKITNDKTTAIELILPWINSGNTPTRRAVSMIDFDTTDPQGMQDHFDFSDRDKSYKPRQFAIAPKGLGNATETVPIVLMQLAQSQTRHLYVWGWITYHDIFNKTPTRLSEFCDEVVNIQSSKPI